MDSSAVIRRIEARLARWDVERRISEGLGEKLSLSGKKNSPALGVVGPDEDDASDRELGARDVLHRQAMLLVKRTQKIMKDLLDSPQSFFLFSSEMKTKMERIVRHLIVNEWVHHDKDTIHACISDAMAAINFGPYGWREHLDPIFKTALGAILIKEFSLHGMYDDIMPKRNVVYGNHERVPLHQFMNDHAVLGLLIDFVQNYRYATPDTHRGYHFSTSVEENIVKGFMAFITPVVMPDDMENLVNALQPHRRAIILKALG